MEKQDLNVKITEKIKKIAKDNTPIGSKSPYGSGITEPSIWTSLEISEEEAREFLLNEDFFRFMVKVTGSTYSYFAIIDHIISIHPSVSEIILSASKGSKLFNFKSTLVMKGKYVGDLSKKKFKQDDDDLKIAFLKVCSFDEVLPFKKDSSARVREQAFWRIGIFSCAEEMANDTSPDIRQLICNHLPFDHPILEKFMNDRSKNVYWDCLRKINKEKIPMMLGSNHLKDSYVRKTLETRLGNLGEKNEI